MTRIIENIKAHYETHEVPFGRGYEWHPGHIIVECDCGERFPLTATSTTATCQCGADLGAIVHDTQEQEKQHRQDEAAYSEDSSWRYNDVTSGLGDDVERWKKA